VNSIHNLIHPTLSPFQQAELSSGLPVAQGDYACNEQTSRVQICFPDNSLDTYKQ
jgi:hypothetical protein